MLVWCVTGSAVAHAATAAIGEVDARTEIAAALFAASATQAAAERLAVIMEFRQNLRNVAIACAHHGYSHNGAT